MKIEHNETISIGLKNECLLIGYWDWTKLKKPVLGMRVNGCLYKLASFNDEKSAEMFIDFMSKLLNGEVEDNG